MGAQSSTQQNTQASQQYFGSRYEDIWQEQEKAPQLANLTTQ